jgi:SP family sugar:H+ symporter-like MFS transporter
VSLKWEDEREREKERERERERERHRLLHSPYTPHAMRLRLPSLRRKASPPLSTELNAVEKGTSDEDTSLPRLTLWTFFMAVLVSMGGMVFGYDTGQISGFLEMRNFEENFGDESQPLGSSVVRSGLIVGMLSIGTLVGALVAAPVANTRVLGRKFGVCLWCGVFDVGVVVQMASSRGTWEEVMIGRIIAGLGIGALSVIVPMYQGETAPGHNRGAVVCCYQLFITVGILVANLINFGTERIRSEASWRIVMGMGFVWNTVLGVGILAFPETPRWDFRMGRVGEARKSIAMFHGVGEGHRVVGRQMEELRK